MVGSLGRGCRVVCSIYLTAVLASLVSEPVQMVIGSARVTSGWAGARVWDPVPLLETEPIEGGVVASKVAPEPQPVQVNAISTASAAIPGQRERQDLEVVPLDSLATTQSPRLTGVNIDHVRALAECVDQLPPIIVHRATMRVVDGVHRLHAVRSLGRDMIRVRFFEGDEAAAFVVAVQSNVKHGMPLSLAERTRAASRIIHSHPQWSDRMIAAIAGLSPKTVGAIRARSSEEIPQSDHRVGLDGRLRKVRRTSVPSTKPSGAAQATRRLANPATQPASSPRRDELEVPPPRSESSAGALAKIVSQLRQDPSLRFTEGGRLLLRLLDTCMLDQQQWNQIVQSTPAHHVGTVAELARECAVYWDSVADQLARRPGSAVS